MSHPGDDPHTPTLPISDDIEPEVTTIEVDPQSIVPAREPSRARQDGAGSSREPTPSTLRYYCLETREYQTYHGRECRCGAARSFPDTLVHGVEQERDYLETERLRLSDLRDYYQSESDRFRRIAIRERDRVEALEAEDQVQQTQIAAHLVTADLLRNDLEVVQEQHIATLEENAELRSQVHRQEAQLERFRQMTPDWEERFAELESDDELLHDEFGAAVEIEPEEPIADEEAELGEPEMDMDLEPVELLADDDMDITEQGSDTSEEPLEHDEDDDPDYDVDAERDDSSDDSDGGSGDRVVPEAGWITE